MPPANPRRRTSFFLLISVLFLLIALTGFSKTFIAPTLNGSFKAPPIVYIHGALAFGWVALFLLQAWLVKTRRTKIHMRLGRLGFLIALAILLTMVPIGHFQVQKDLANGAGEFAYPVQLGTIVSGLLFFGLVSLAIYWRKKPAAHKRIMVLATIVLLWPAWFRLRHFFPQIPRPDIWLALVAADSLILIAWAWDWIKNKTIHPSWLYAGIFVIVEQSLEVFVYFEWQAYRNVSKSVFFWVDGLIG